MFGQKNVRKCLLEKKKKMFEKIIKKEHVWKKIKWKKIVRVGLEK